MLGDLKLDGKEVIEATGSSVCLEVVGEIMRRRTWYTKQPPKPEADDAKASWLSNGRREEHGHQEQERELPVQAAW